MTRRWLIDLPTRLHLWTAEQEIRHRSPSSDPERLQNLDVLRDYRKSRAFPRNDTALRSTPYDASPPRPTSRGRSAGW